MDRCGEHYAKWNKSVRERQINIWFHSYVESNEQTELTSKTDRLIDGEQDDSCSGAGEFKGWRDWAKRTKDMDMDCWGGEGIMELNGDGKTIQ